MRTATREVKNPDADPILQPEEKLLLPSGPHDMEPAAAMARTEASTLMQPHHYSSKSEQDTDGGEGGGYREGKGRGGSI